MCMDEREIERAWETDRTRRDEANKMEWFRFSINSINVQLFLSLGVSVCERASVCAHCYTGCVCVCVTQQNAVGIRHTIEQKRRTGITMVHQIIDCAQQMWNDSIQNPNNLHCSHCDHILFACVLFYLLIRFHLLFFLFLLHLVGVFWRWNTNLFHFCNDSVTEHGNIPHRRRWQMYYCECCCLLVLLFVNGIMKIARR